VFAHVDVVGGFEGKDFCDIRFWLAIFEDNTCCDVGRFSNAFDGEGGRIDGPRKQREGFMYASREMFPSFAYADDHHLIVGEHMYIEIPRTVKAMLHTYSTPYPS
jgi:hypothetical protein